MYKAIIVDDEEEVRVGIISKIAWEQFNFSIIGQAENGREALDLIEDETPDVVITDIAMPLIDGLELSAILKEKYPTVKTVILTGFDDFKFAQQAIKYGVADYLLKPILPSDINSLMEKLKTELDTEIAQKEDISKLRQHYAESLPIIKEKFLSSLISGNTGRAEMEMKIDSLHLCLAGEKFIAAVARIDSRSLEGNPFGDEGDELASFAVLNIAREVLEKHSVGEVFMHDDNLVVLAGFADADKTAVVNKSIAVLDEIRQSVEKYLKITVTIGLGSILCGLEKIKDSYKSALSALEYSIVIGENKVIFLEDIEPDTAYSVVFDENRERMLAASIKFGTEKDVLETMNCLFREITPAKATFMEYQLYFMEILAAISRIARIFDFDIAAMLGNKSSLYQEILKFNTMAEAKSWCEGICIRLMKHISHTRQNSTQLLVEKAKDFIAENYGDNDLSIQKLADYLHISSCYLSMIFKKETDETFLKYLVRIRLEAAKELLRNTDLKSTEIAEKIGYPDINYFSYFFKKNLGMSPREYRSKTGSKEQ